MRFLILISLIFFNNCSFDNKTGIWKNNDRLLVNKKDKDLFEDFRKITVSEGVFNKEIPLEDKSQIKLKNLLIIIVGLTVILIMKIITLILNIIILIRLFLKVIS